MEDSIIDESGSWTFCPIVDLIKEVTIALTQGTKQTANNTSIKKKKENQNRCQKVN